MDVLESSKKYYLDVNLEEAETSIRASLKDAARSVIAVGHYLKVIRDKELYREAGYENVWDYAADTFGFSKSTAERQVLRGRQQPDSRGRVPGVQQGTAAGDAVPGRGTARERDTRYDGETDPGAEEAEGTAIF